MPWKHNGRIIQENKAWVADDNTKNPGTWSSWSADEKKAKDLVWEDPTASPQPFDNRFYTGRQANGTLIERSLADINVVDSDDKAVIDPSTGKQMVQLGLKSVWVTATKATAQAKLNKHDWMIVRNAEKSTAIPSDVTTYRDAIRTKCASIETSINNCSSLADFIKLFDVPVDSDKNPTGNAPIYDFPDEV